MVRIQKLINCLKNGQGLLCTSRVNARYLSGFDFCDGYLFVSSDRTVLFTDFRYVEQARQEIGDKMEICCMEGGLKKSFEGVFGMVESVLYEDRELVCSFLVKLKEMFPQTEFTPCGSLLDDLRTVKESDEIEKIISAQRIAESAFDDLLNVISPSMTETEVAAELEYRMRRRGAEGVSFETIAISGNQSSKPHGVPRPIQLEKGFLTLDFGALYDGYCSDMTRTLCIGKADDEMKRVYNTVKEAQKAALDFIDCGKTGKEIDSVARNIIDNAGYKGCFGHALGHGVGMKIHEYPTLSPSSDTRLGEGHVVTVEPGIYIAGKYGVRIEDMVVIQGGKCLDITKTPRDLIEICK